MESIMDEYVCFVCNKPISDIDIEHLLSAHWCHEPDCPVINGCEDFECECDLIAHEECCPMCNPKSLTE